MFRKAEQKAGWGSGILPVTSGVPPALKNDVCRQIRCTCYEISDQYHLISSKIGNIITAAVITCSLEQNETGILQIASVEQQTHWQFVQSLKLSMITHEGRDFVTKSDQK